MKIVAITDKKGSAIDRLARMNEKRLPHLRYVVCTLHPKRPSNEEIETLRKELEDATMVDAQYWRSAMKARELFPAKATDVPWVLTHHNEHNIHDTAKDHWTWKDVTWAAHVCKNQWQRAELKKDGIDALLIPHAVEFSNFIYKNELTEDKVVGYVGQIKKVKGVREIAQACKELGYKLLIVGSVSETDYWNELHRDFEGTIITRYPGILAVPDEGIGNAYWMMRAYCANSDDGTESGTMPILEAMVSGIPVVARRFGLVRDCGENQRNMIVRTGAMKDVEDLKQALRMVVENKDIADTVREAAWRTVRMYHPDRQAREYERLFRAVAHPGQIPVSIIMPTCGRNKEIAANIAVIAEQSHKNIELVVCDDNQPQESAVLEEVLSLLRQKVAYPIKHIKTGKDFSDTTYGLAKARNLGLIEATGDIVVFCDDRHKMHHQAVAAFVQKLSDYAKNNEKKVWLWGSKGVFKTFVENFSATWRRTIIDGGMFNERMDRYGGMTQELSGRFNAQKVRFDFCPQALAEPMFGTHSKSAHREDIIASKVKLYKMGFQ